LLSRELQSRFVNRSRLWPVIPIAPSSFHRSLHHYIIAVDAPWAAGGNALSFTALEQLPEYNDAFITAYNETARAIRLD
jgi:hypothetical protein